MRDHRQILLNSESKPTANLITLIVTFGEITLLAAKWGQRRTRVGSSYNRNVSPAEGQDTSEDTADKG